MLGEQAPLPAELRAGKKSALARTLRRLPCFAVDGLENHNARVRLASHGDQLSPPPPDSPPPPAPARRPRVVAKRTAATRSSGFAFARAPAVPVGRFVITVTNERAPPEVDLRDLLRAKRRRDDGGGEEARAVSAPPPKKKKAVFRVKVKKAKRAKAAPVPHLPPLFPSLPPAEAPPAAAAGGAAGGGGGGFATGAPVRARRVDVTTVMELLRSGAEAAERAKLQSVQQAG